MPTINAARAALYGAAAILATGCAAGGPTAETAENAAPAAAATAENAGEPPRVAAKTSKPGPAIEMRLDLRGKVMPGDAGVATLRISDGYADGVMSLTASSKTGLGVFPTSGATSYSMAGDAPHLWDVYFKSDVAGVHYLDVYAVATDADNVIIGARSFSFQIAVGDAAAPAAKTGPAPNVSGEGADRKIILDAEETISEAPQ